jgi:23S rRNA (adenine-N6)-dimethyltransferase
VRAIAARYWGWHRLDRAWAARVAAAADVRPGDLVLDVGAGEGSLTEALLCAGARVIAVELHPGRAASLRRRFAGRAVRVVAADAADLRLPRRPFTVVANPPFAVATALLKRLVAPGSRLDAADVVVPRHIARQWCGNGVHGSIRWGGVFEVTVGLRLPAHAFMPAAPRDAVVLRLRRLDDGSRPDRAGRRRKGPPAS